MGDLASIWALSFDLLCVLNCCYVSCQVVMWGKGWEEDVTGVMTVSGGKKVGAFAFTGKRGCFERAGYGGTERMAFARSVMILIF